MSHPDGAHTHGAAGVTLTGGGVLVLAGLGYVLTHAHQAAQAVTAAVQVLAIAVAVVVVTGAVGGTLLIRRVMRQNRAQMAWRAQQVEQERQRREALAQARAAAIARPAYAAPAIQAAEPHYHLHIGEGVSPETADALVRGLRDRPGRTVIEPTRVIEA